jgi:thioredoxin 2
MAEDKVLACPSCGQKNRVRAAAAGVPHCAKCGKPIPWLVDISAGDFRTGVEKSPVPVLADFWAPWCAPCRMVAPVVERLAGDLAGGLKVVKVNTDDQPELGERFSVRGIPTLILFEGGREKDRVTGALPAQALRTWLETRLGPAGKK